MKLTKTQIRRATDSFKSVTVKHRLQTETLDLALFMLELSPNCDIVNLVGPTGIGKSFLQARVIASVHEDERANMAANPDLVPIIRTHALAAGHRLFDWKSLYRGALLELGDPFADDRKALAKWTVGGESLTGETPKDVEVKRARFDYAGESRTASELRMFLEREFRRRQTRIWIIDEAQHLVFGGKSGQPGDQFDVLKSIAQNAGVKLMLAGPHDMEAGLGSSSQLARRSITIHFPRYSNTDVEDMKTFAGVVMTLFKKMDVSGYPAVKENLSFLYSGCVGCIGLLKDWLAKAYGLALRDQTDDTKAVLTLDHLRATRLSIDSMQTIMYDIRREEERSKVSPSDADYERIVSGVPAKHPSLKRYRIKSKARVAARALGYRDQVPRVAPANDEQVDVSEEKKAA